MSVPIPESYWVEPGRLLAGEYPGERTDDETLRRLQAFVAAGVTSFLDLTEADESFYESFSAYQHLLDRSSRYLRMSIPDLGCPKEQEMLAILDRLDHELADGRVVYVHCYGGLGRTGTVVGCWLTRRGFTGEQALERIPILREAIPDPAWNLSPAMRQLLGDAPNAGHHLSPQTQQQREFVRAWPSHDVMIGARVPPYRSTYVRAVRHMLRESASRVFQNRPWPRA
jgi:Swiss Army Knife protein, DSP-PTPase phosphatase domain